MISNTSKTPTAWHITNTMAKVHLNIESSFTADDDYITEVIKDAFQIASDYIDKDIAVTTVVLEIYDYVGTGVLLNDVPFTSITTVTYLDSAGSEQTVTKSEIEIRKYGQKTTLVLPDSLDTDLLTVTYVTGYADGDAMPRNIWRALYQKIADLYDVNRGSMISKAFVDSGAFERALEFNRKISY